MSNKNDLIELEKKIGYVFNNKELLKMALTHKSYAYEDSNVANREYNERIEFLGDAILEHIISDLLYFSKQKFSEGNMSKKRADIVCEKSLSTAMRNVGAQNYIYLGKCEKSYNNVIKDAIVADAFEAILGAIYIDGGYDYSKKFALMMLKQQIDSVLHGKELNVDYKTKLQELLQKHGAVKIEYIIDKEYGPEHDKTFEVSVYFNGNKIGEGKGKNKNEAEQMAAKVALKIKL